MKRELGGSSLAAFLLALIVFLVSPNIVGRGPVLLAQNHDNPPPGRHVRSIKTYDFAISRQTGLIYSPRARMFLAVPGHMAPQRSSAETVLLLLSPTGGPHGSVRIEDPIPDPVNVAFDPVVNRLLSLNAKTGHLLEIAAADGIPDPRTLARHKVRYFAVQDPQGMAVDPVSGHLFILDAEARQLLRVEPDVGGGFEHARVSRIDLQVPKSVGLRGLAFEPTTAHMHLLSPTEQTIYEVSGTGQVLSVRDVSELGLSHPQAMVFAPSADLTDDPAEMSLYITDSGLRSGTQEDGAVTASAVEQDAGHILEVSIGRSETLPATAYVSSLLQTINTAQWSPASPDPSGITYLGEVDSLLISDSEVNEMPIFMGDNLFKMDLSGTVNDTLTTVPFSDEPTGVSYNPLNGHLFFSDDQGNPGTKSIYELDPGPDGAYDTPDDVVTSFSTTLFNSFDPEGIAFDPTDGILFIVDGINSEVYRLSPGEDGLFNGVPPEGDDEVTSFDTKSLGIPDPEGITLESDSDTLYLVGEPVTAVAQISKDGELLRLIDISEAAPFNPAGLAYAPRSSDRGDKSLYVTDRGVDNDIDPTENDGRIYEMSIFPLTLGNTAPVVDAGPDQTVAFQDGAKLEGAVRSDDGVPIPGAMTWSQVNGPGLVTFGAAGERDTTARFTLPGTYVLRLTGDDGELTGSDDVKIVVTGEADVAHLDARIIGTEPDNPFFSTDDVEEIDNATSSLDRFSGDLDFRLDRGKARTNRMVGLRFNAVNIPTGVHITNAYVQFETDEFSSATTSLIVQGQADDSPETFGFDNKLSLRPRTTAAVPWSPPPWTTIGEAGVGQRTPNIGPILQEIVDRDGWSSGNAVVIMVSGTGERTAVSFEGDPSAAPYLHVEYGLRVPNVVDLSQADAEIALVEAGLTVGTPTLGHSDSVPRGSVISQTPAAGGYRAPGAGVKLVISLGPALVSVPDVIGLPQDRAQVAITDAGLTTGAMDQEYSESLPMGNVVRQTPYGGTLAVSGAEVDLVISLGPASGGQLPEWVQHLPIILGQ